MPSNITDSATYTTPVQVPSDGEPANVASLILPIQALSNRTAYAKARLDALTAARTVTRCVNVTTGGYAASGGWSINSLGNWGSTADFGSLTLDVSEGLEDGASLTSIQLRINPGAARAGGNRMRALIRLRDEDGVVTDLTASGTSDDTTTNSQDLVVTPDAPHTIDRDLYVYTVVLFAGSDGSSNNDLCIGVAKCICVMPAIAYP